MKFEFIDAVSVPGNPDRPNEDAFAHTDQMAVVFDGVTAITEPLMPGASDPAWLATFAARRLAAHSADGDDPREWMKNAAADAQKSYNALRRRGPKERYENPYASLTVVAIAGDQVQAFWMGDCIAIMQSPDGATQVLGDAIESRARERAMIAKLAAEENTTPAESLAREDVRKKLCARRNKFNTAGGTWLFTPDPKCAKHAQSDAAPLAGGARVLVASDGFFALVTEYALYTVPELMAACEKKGLAALATEVRAIEAEDPEGVKYPRFKKSDDATALIVRAMP